MEIPTKIVEGVRKGQCILFLGAMAVAADPPAGSPFKYKATLPGGKALSNMLADKCGYPDGDKDNLQRVSLFFQCREHNSREDLIKAIGEIFAQSKAVPSPPLDMLAALPFRIIITTNYDALFEKALYKATTRDGEGKSPVVTVYDPDRNGPPDKVTLDPPEASPILLKLHGDITKPNSIVITEEDYITFIQRMASPHFHPIHENIRARMNEWPILFVGYSLRDFNLRLLFKTLRWHVDPANYPLSFSVDPSPDNLIVSILQRGPKPMVSFIQENLWDFVPALYKACMGKEYEDE
ncbi:MAG TPA: SIR2 family protein [Blastocatellia bacterium]|nr:SIR2 family protein [Blastocatellia bacterium]